MKDNQNEQLFTELTAESEAPAFTELDDEVAASCSGGVAYLYQDDNFLGRRLQFFNGESDLRRWNFNDETSSLEIVGNERWEFYRDISFGGYPVTLSRGRYTLTDLRGRGISNDSISSLRRVGS
jgi:hypothetical protein